MAVLGTKVPIPTLRRDLVERDRLTARLIERLAGGDLPRLVLVSAAPGFGKTTVLARVSHPRWGNCARCPRRWPSSGPLLLEPEVTPTPWRSMPEAPCR